jgi:dihydrofolate synthase/folylpolyglutamate synthase
VHAVLDAMALRAPPYGVITVAGTNGKGSTVAMLDAILRAAGYRVGAYTSPHLVRYNERVRVDGMEASDGELCRAFERIEQARGATPLTYFEFGTLAAFECFQRARIDVALLEVGMGGRLDAVNAVDADCTVLTAIDIDHTAWLGDTREAIAREKAGIFRAGRPAVVSDPDPPAVVAEVAAAVGAHLHCINRDFAFERSDGGWNWRGRGRVRTGLPYPAMRGDYQLLNAAGVLMALELLADRFPVTQTNVRDGLLNAVVPGRFQVLPGRPTRVLDVGHNPHAARALAATLRQQPARGRSVAVIGMLKDKDVAGVAQALAASFDAWHVATLATERGATAQELAATLRAHGVTAPISLFADPIAAYESACRNARDDDRVVVFGSFYTVGDILARLS